MSRDPSRRRAFTLVELLVVLGILAVLSAILFPVFARARESARKTTCVAQLSQLYKAAKMYIDDNDRTLVPARTEAVGSGTRGVTWCVLLQPYLQSRQVLICPTDPEPAASADSLCLPHSYGINYLLSFNNRWGTYPFVARMGTVSRVSDTVLFFELKDEVAEMGASFYSHRLSRVSCRHNQKGNFGFLDGHIKTLGTTVVDNARSWDPFTG